MTPSRELPPLARSDARTLIDRFGSASVLVVGDVMLDQFLVGRVDRISPEAPVPIVAFDREEIRIGGAANVAHNVRRLGGRVLLAGVVGADASGERLASALEAHGLENDGLVVDTGRCTTVKARIVTDRNQQVARVDYESDREVSGRVQDALIERALRFAPDAGAIVVSDYLKGAITGAVMSRLVAVAREHGVPLLVDPKIPHLAYYAGASIVTPNHHEAEMATRLRIRSDPEAQAAARVFRQLAATDGVLVTRGEHGMWLLDAAHEGRLAATARQVADVTGAGDTVIGTLGLALAAGATSADAACLANHAAGVVVGKFGPATVHPSELLQAVPDAAPAAVEGGREHRAEPA